MFPASRVMSGGLHSIYLGYLRSAPVLKNLLDSKIITPVYVYVLTYAVYAYAVYNMHFIFAQTKPITIF